MIENMEKLIREEVPRFEESGYLGPDGILALREDENIVFYRTGDNGGVLSSTEIGESGTNALVRAIIAIFQERPDIKVLVHSSSPFTAAAARAGATVRPQLDDMAQIVGVSVKVAELSNPQSVKNKFKHRNAVLLRSGGALCGAGSFYDLYAVCMVLEKNCRTVIQSSFIGTGHTINVFESMLMRFVYQQKYSKNA